MIGPGFGGWSMQQANEGPLLDVRDAVIPQFFRSAW